MTPGQPRSRAPFPTLLGLAVVLLVMAVTLAFVWLNGSEDLSVCTSTHPDSTMGDCLLSAQLGSMRTDLLGVGALTLLAGGIVASGVGLVQLLWDRRR